MNIKRSAFNLSAAAALLFVCAACVCAQKLDLSMREDIYVTNKNDGKIDLKNDPYVKAGGILEVTTARAAGTGTRFYTFFLGVLVNREGGDLSKGFSTKLNCKVAGSGYTDIREIGFGPKEQSKPQLFLAELKLGDNYVTINLDPEKSYVETNEFNNKISVNIKLKAGPPPIRKNKVDYSTTNILYLLKDKDFHPGKDMHVNLFGDRQMLPGAVNSISMNDGMKGTCSFSKTDSSQGHCTFHIGVIAKRAWQTLVAGPDTTIKIMIDNDPKKISTFNVKMGPYITDQDFVIYEDLNFGTHTVKVQIDPLNMVDEKDENNNNFTVTLNVHK